MATGKARGGKKLTQLSRRSKPAAGSKAGKRAGYQKGREKPISGIGSGSPQLGRLRKESGAAVSASELSTLRRAIRKESGAAVSAKELRDFLRRKPRGK